MDDCRAGDADRADRGGHGGVAAARVNEQPWLAALLTGPSLITLAKIFVLHRPDPPTCSNPKPRLSRRQPDLRLHLTSTQHSPPPARTSTPKDESSFSRNVVAPSPREMP